MKAIRRGCEVLGDRAMAALVPLVAGGLAVSLFKPGDVGGQLLVLLLIKGGKVIAQPCFLSSAREAGRSWTACARVTGVPPYAMLLRCKAAYSTQPLR